MNVFLKRLQHISESVLEWRWVAPQPSVTERELS